MFSTELEATTFCEEFKKLDGQVGNNRKTITIGEEVVSSTPEEAV